MQKFLDAAKNQNLKVDHLRPAMIIDQKEDLVLGTLWEILKVLFFNHNIYSLYIFLERS